MDKLYIVKKRGTLQANGKEYTKDKIISAADAGQENIARFLAKGYIKPLDGEHEADKPDHSSASGYLSPEEVNKMTKGRRGGVPLYCDAPDRGEEREKRAGIYRHSQNLVRSV